MVKTMKKNMNTNLEENKELQLFTEYVGKALEKEKRYYFKNIGKIDNICVNVEIKNKDNWGMYLIVCYENTMNYDIDDNIRGYISCINKPWSIDVAREFLSDINNLFYSKIMGMFYTSKEKEEEAINKVRDEDTMSVLFTSPRLLCDGKQIDTCCVCLEETIVKTPCNHHLCYGCRYRLEEDEDDMKKCPLCRETF
jgi:hypothetical protein